MPLVEHPMAILAIFLTILATIFNVANHPKWGRMFRIVPPIVFAYFIPMFLTTAGVIPDASPLYTWIKSFLLPVALFLFTIALDLPMILKLGPKAIGMMLIGTFGIIVGGPLSLWICQAWLPPDAWQGMSALAGSWIGGGANMVALKESVQASDAIFGPIIVVDVAVASVWMGLLIFAAGRYEIFNRWFKADRSSIDHVQKKMEEYQASVSRVTTFPDLLFMIGLAFVFTWFAYLIGNYIPPIVWPGKGQIIGHFAWRVILITTFGLIFSFTRVRKYEGAGASKLGNVALYLLITAIGAQANLRGIVEYPAFVLMGVVWLVFHGVILVAGAKMMRAPLFFLAVGSQANVGGAASAPVVAAAFHPSLAPVGILLGILGYVLGTYAALVCSLLLRLVAGV